MPGSLEHIAKVNPESHRSEPIPLTNAEEQYPLQPGFLDPTVYTDPDQFERELKLIFHRSWLPVCPSADLAEPRSYKVWDHLRQSVLLVRQDDGTVAAWHNVCQHRGARLVEDSGVCDKGVFVCPWHGFRYGLKGEVQFVTLAKTFDPQCIHNLRVPPVRTAEWAGFIWINLAGEGPDLQTFLGKLWDELGYYGMERFAVRYRRTLDIDANWKAVVDAFNETWHVPFTHNASLGRLILWRDAHLYICPPHSWMALPVAGFTERLGPQADHHAANVCHYTAFPNTIFSCFPTHLQMWSVWPVSPEKTVLSAWGIVGPTPEGLSEREWQERNDRDWAHFMRVMSEDTSVINRLSTVSHSAGLKRLMFNTAESRLTAFHREVLQIVGGVEKLSGGEPK